MNRQAPVADLSVRAASNLEQDVIRGLMGTPKRIPSSYLYDARGSDLFEQITALPEYYPTRTEIAILTKQAVAIASAIGPVGTLVEFGSGSSRKIECLLSAVRPAVYVPVEISSSALATAIRRLRACIPGLRTQPCVADYRTLPKLADRLAPVLGFFPGSTLGNETPAGAVDLLAHFARLLGPSSRLLVGIDLRKDPAIVRCAYDDAAGVTAEFNRNLLVRANRELGANFRIDMFRHVTTYDVAAGRLDMWLESLIRQTVYVAGRTIVCEAGERIHTEQSHKYDLGAIAEMAESAEWRLAESWTDPYGWFAVVLLDRRS